MDQDAPLFLAGPDRLFRFRDLCVAAVAAGDRLQRSGTPVGNTTFARDGLYRIADLCAAGDRGIARPGAVCARNPAEAAEIDAAPALSATEHDRLDARSRSRTARDYLRVELSGTGNCITARLSAAAARLIRSQTKLMWADG